MITPLETAMHAAQTAGRLLRENFGTDLTVNAAEAHDIKLELDVRAQERISEILLSAHPGHSILGEEGNSGSTHSEWEWIVDPIDGTVNYFYGIPHFCISIALRRAGKMIVGVIYDPMRNELWSVDENVVPNLNGRPIRVSSRTKLSEAVVMVGFSKSASTIDAGLPYLGKMLHAARKCRLMGSAALDLAYIASGRLDAYVEQGVSIWDIAAGQLLIERAGGKVLVTPLPGDETKLAVVASNGLINLEAA